MSARKSAGHSSPPPTPRRFRLSGPSARLDPRIHAVRRDVADVALADQVFAPHYARPLDHGCAVTAVPMRASASMDAPAVSELLHGESFAVVDSSGDWAWGYSRHDNYVGYVPLTALDAPISATHIVDVPAALVFSAPDIKAPVVERLPMGARIAIEYQDGAFLRTASGLIHSRHLRAIDDHATDVVATASRLTGTPYRWGGRSGDGIDCSGLIQIAFALSGVAVPRDSDQQSALGHALTETRALRRGDLVFLPGHVGIMANDTHLLHANAHWMAVVTEPLADVLARQPDGRGITAMRRLVA